MNKLIPFVAALIFIGCGKKAVTPAPANPGKSTLIAPGQNSLCTTGTDQTDAQTRVFFSWYRSDNTENFDLVIRNLLTNEQITNTTNETQFSVLLRRNTPYEWYVVSKKAASPSQRSDSWRFYTSGIQTVDYAPFPAVVSFPRNGDIFYGPPYVMNISWTGGDVDNDIAGYDLFMSNNRNSLVLVKSDIKEMELKNIPVQKGTTYYWQIITKDKKGNSSASYIYQFSMN